MAKETNMKLTDLLPLDAWVELEREITRQSGLSGNIFDVAGVRITDYRNRANRLCPEIKANDKGQSFICAVAHQNLAAQAKQTRRPIVEECDAGIAKVVVPIWVDDEFLGAACGCGSLLEGGEVDTFLVNKITGIDEEEIERLSHDIGTLSAEEANALVNYLEIEIEKIVQDYRRNRKSGAIPIEDV